MIAFRPVPPDTEDKVCSLCDGVTANPRFLMNNSWDRTLGSFSQLDEDSAGNPIPESELNYSPTAIVHFYCYLMYRPGNARIRYGMVDAKVAIYSHEKQAWEAVLMTEHGLSPLCGDCHNPIGNAPKTTIQDTNWSGETGAMWIHEGCGVTCEQCEQRVRDSLMTHLGDEEYPWRGCRSCYRTAVENDEFFSCSWCGNSYLHDSLAWEENRYYTCNGCENRIHTCDDCGNFYDSDSDRHYHEVIQDYGSHPRPRFYPDGKQQYYLGFELEVEVDEDSDKYKIAEDLLRQVNKSITDSKYLYLKEDGSLDHGFEIVTHPFTLEFHQQFDLSFLERLTSQGVRSWDRDTCGFHVHISRSAFTSRVMGQETGRYSKAHELRFTSLIYLNREKFIRFAGRQSNDYASFYDDDTDSVTTHVLKKAKGREGTRFQAVNVQNSSTIEVRIFRGSLKRERVLANLEMVHACVEYTRNLGESVVKSFAGHELDTALRWNRFRSWLLTNEKFYPHVNHYVTQLSL